MPPKKHQPSVTQNVTGDNNIVIAGNENTVNQTIIQKFFNIFKSDAEAVDQRNRRIMLGHVENFWVKGILEKSLHGAALLELGIKEDPDALTYPWAIKREPNKETLPAGTSMLEIFEEIGMGRSLLILGAPGSGKTTMLLELTRQLIERTREDLTEPIPVVFNLSSWTEKLTLSDWLVRELNVIYSIPKKTALTWIKENKMLLLLDGLDEVKQASRDGCVDAINQFRKENGLTGMTVCSRIQDYADLKARLAFDGAIEIQPLTSNQVNDYLKRLGKELAGINQALEKDTVLREMTETPLFLSIMTLAYRDTESKNILVSENVDIQRKQLFDTYIARMFERPERSKNESFNKQDVLDWLTWLAKNMIEHNQIPYLMENMRLMWQGHKEQRFYRVLFGITFGIIGMLMFGSVMLFVGFEKGATIGMLTRLSLLCFFGFTFGILGWLGYWVLGFLGRLENTVDTLTWDWMQANRGLRGGFAIGMGAGFVSLLIVIFDPTMNNGENFDLYTLLLYGLGSAIGIGLIGMLSLGMKGKSISQTSYPGQKIFLSAKNALFGFLLGGLVGSLTGWLGGGPTNSRWELGLSLGMAGSFYGGLYFGGLAVIQHYIFRFTIAYVNLLPWRLIPFLNHCVDLIFLRRVGGGYIFVHRLLMEHFADMYPAQEK